jgi:hypothetical protein
VGYYAVFNTWSLYSISKLYHFEKVIDFYRMLRYYLKRIASLHWNEVRDRFLPAIKNRILSKTSASQAQTESENKQEFTVPARQYDETLEPVKEAKWASERPENNEKIKHPMTVYRNESKPYWRIKSDELGWNYLAEQVKVIQLKETVHEAILREPHVGHFASQLREDLLNSQ